MLAPHLSTSKLAEASVRPLVVGLGTTGFSVVRYLRSLGLTVSVVDSRLNPPNADRLAREYPEVECAWDSFDSEAAKTLFEQCDLMVVNPGLSLRLPPIMQAKKRGVKAVVDIELFLQANDRDVIAITGTNGKTTVTTLVGEILKVCEKIPLVAGNIGASPLDALTDGADYDVAVLELSSFQLEGISRVGARVATILNVSDDHMDRYSSFGDYALAKARILRGAEAAVLPRYFNALEQISPPSNTTYFGFDAPTAGTDFGIKKTKKNTWLVKGSERIMKLAKVRLVGRHNANNVLAALALVDALDVDLKVASKAVKQFQGIAHRMEQVAHFSGVTWINDSKATNLGAAVAAISSLEQPIVWLAGGDAKGATFAPLERRESKYLKTVILYGRDAEQVGTCVPVNIPKLQVNTLHDAVQHAAQVANSGDAVLLSPACASFDQYSDYQARGREFCAAVTELRDGGRHE